MRCKKHSSDLSSSVGVCSSCLRERLIALIAAQAQAQAQQAQLLQRATTIDDHLRKQDHRPPPLVFPRSVSPYVTRRKSDHSSPATWPQFDHRFYSTPQLGPTSATSTSTFTNSRSYRKKHTSRLSLFSNIFRSRSDKLNPDHRVSPREDATSSWFSTIFPYRRKKQSRLFSLEDATVFSGRRINRGMSPEMEAESDDDRERSPSASGYSSESSHGWKRTPSAVRRTRPGHVRNVSGLAFCLSPLVRASPTCRWNRKGCLPPDMAFSGEIRGTVKPHLSTAASFCANRSKKLVDLGKVNHNR
ncbi:hypothetical protein CFOL_v3_15295 [Cephalotus follicularis]|uniref:DUF740 domain-containing protein n=1 Tax=Cephalotus follicularis TaxID=3775 RepID=A0A1Q3BV38_CEPFO|nr:hypothetical protein CFOL_v3_15295 [Cephalotus follicularis]